MNASPTSVSGFTLVELMVVVAIAGILAMIAIPGFKSLTQSQQVKNASFELYASLNLARSEAIKRNSNVTITMQTHSVNFPAPTHDEISWVVAAGATTIRNQSQLKGITLSPVSNITYQRNGRATSATTFLIDAYGATTPYARCIKIELSGMPRIYKPSSGVC